MERVSHDLFCPRCGMSPLMVMSTDVSGIPTRVVVYKVKNGDHKEGEEEDGHLLYVSINRPLGIRCKVTVSLKTVREHVAATSPGWNDKWWDTKLINAVARKLSAFLRYEYDEKGKLGLSLPYYSLKVDSLQKPV